MGSTLNFQSRHPALIMIGILLLACNLSRLRPGGSTSTGNTKQGSSAKTNATQPFKPGGDARADVLEALRRLESAYPYRLTETTTGTSAREEIVRVAEFAAPDRVHVRLGTGPDTSEFITIGDTRYWSHNGKWQETKEALTKGAEPDIEKLIVSGLKDVQPGGNETVSGIAAYVYATRFEYNIEGTTYNSTGKVWIGATDGLPHQVDTVLKVANYESKSHIVYEYNVDIKVEKPVP